MIEVNILTEDFISYEITLQINWSQVCKDIRPSHIYIHKVTQIWCFYQNKRCVRSYEEIKGGVENKLDFGFWKI